MMNEEHIKRMAINNVNVWIVKMPRYITECWYSLNAGDELGILRIENERIGGKSSIFFSNDLPNFSPEMSYPVEHVLKDVPIDDMKDWAYSKQEPQGLMTIEGCLMRKMKCVPVFNKHYRKVLKSNFAKAHQRRRVLCLEKIISEKPEYAHVNLYYNPTNCPKFEHYNNFRPLDTDVLKRMIIYAFDKREFYTLWDLQKLTKQTIGQLKPILSEMCTYIKTHPNKFTWTLKEEYMLSREGRAIKSEPEDEYDESEEDEEQNKWDYEESDEEDMPKAKMPKAKKRKVSTFDFLNIN